jgi:hypothetical protein
MKVRAMLAGLAALAVLGAACSASSSEATARIDDPFTHIVVRVGAGDVTVERTTGRTEWFATADFSGDRPAFEPIVVDGELIVDDGCDGLDGCSVRYTVRVPANTTVDAASASGDVTVTELNGTVSVVTTSGTVFLNTVNGTIAVEGGSGDIVGTKLVAANASFTSASGNIDVAFENVIPDLTVETGSGNITAQLADGSYNLDTLTESGTIDTKIDDTDTSANIIVLKTGSGNLTVYRQ